MINMIKEQEINFEELDYSMNELSAYIKEDDYDSAKEILQEILDEVEGIYKEDSEERYFCFDSPLQYYIYDFKMEPKKLIKRCKIDYRTLHLCYAHILVAEECFEEAEEELKKAIYWNPVDCNVLFEFARLYRITGEWNKFLIVIKAVRPYILDKGSFAKYYGNIGEYYLSKNDFQTALSMFYMSDSILSNPLSTKGIDTILNSSQKTLNPPQIEEVIETLKKDAFSYGLDQEIIGLIYDLSYEMQNKLNLKEAVYCLDVLYELTDNEKYLREKELLS